MKARTKMHKLLSMLLALVMVVGLLPAMGQVAYAYSEGDIAGTTGSGASKEDPVVCDTFAEFKAAMENTEITYVKLTGASGAMPSRETFGAAISNTTYKVLTIEGTNRFWSPLNGDNDCLIWPRNELTINGTGTLKYDHGNTGGTGAVINMASNVSLKIDGNVTLEGGANGKSYGYAISAQAGTTKINGGSFIGYSASINDNADVSAVIINSSANLTINGGNFSASLHQNSPEGKKAHSLSITSTATGAISIKEGTFPQGINIKARGKTIENCGYFDTAKASITADGNAVATTASTDVLNGKNVVVTDTSIIASVAVAVTEPVAGAQPQNGVSNTANVNVTITEWYHNGVKMLATDTFAAGETYKVHVIVKPNSGYEFADNPTATFNGSTAGTIYMYGKDYINYYAEFTVPAASTPTTIDTVAISVTAPTAGAAPVVEPAGLPTGVTCEPVLTTVTGWYDSETNTKMASTEKFVEGKTYYICLFLSADTGYSFANPVTTATINGDNASVGFNNGQYLEIKKSFTATAAATTEYDITVTDGKATIGAGTEISKAAEGTEVALTANAAPTDKVFDKWEVISGSITLADANSATTTFTMPASAVSVKATYKDAPHTHTYNQETVKPEALKTPADCTNDAVYFKSCSCGAISTTETFTAAGTQLGHAWASDWSKDTDNHWKECSRCHEKKDNAAHDYGEDNICDTCGYDKTVPHTHNLTLVPAKAPTCTEKGNTAYYTCDGCDKWFEDATGASEITDKTSVVIPASGHTDSDWKSDADNHWKECTIVGCGVIIDGSKAAHTAGEWIIDTPATATTSGSKHKECTVCGYTMATETIPATGGGEHTHSYGSDWKNDADNHWHECSCGDKKDTAAHTAGEWVIDTPATATTSGSKHKECTVCGYVMETGTIPATGTGHTHNYGSDWKSDSTNHWKECSCGDKNDIAAHDFKWVVDKEATATEKGSKHEECKTCGYKRPAVEIPATGTTTAPTDTTKPGNTNGSEKSPQTGDNSNIFLWFALLFVSVAGVTGITVYNKKKKEHAE